MKNLSNFDSWCSQNSSFKLISFLYKIKLFYTLLYSGFLPYDFDFVSKAGSDAYGNFFVYGPLFILACPLVLRPLLDREDSY